MALLSAIGLGVGAIGAGMQFFQGKAAKNKASRGLQQFRHQDLTNLSENLNPSMEAERQMINAASQQRGMISDVASGMDASSAMALMSSGLDQTANMEMQANASMMDKDFQADQMRVQEEQNMRGIVEQRKNQELQSLQAEYNSGAQQMSGAIKDLGGMALSAGISRDKNLSQKGIDTNTFSDGFGADNTLSKQIGREADKFGNFLNKGFKQISQFFKQ